MGNTTQASARERIEAILDENCCHQELLQCVLLLTTVLLKSEQV